MVQWLRLCASNAGGVGSIPNQGIKILAGQKNFKKKSHFIQVLFHLGTLFFPVC